MRIALDGTPLIGRRTGVGRYTERLVSHLPEALARRGWSADLNVTVWSARSRDVGQLPVGVGQIGPPMPARLLRACWTRSRWPTAEMLLGPLDVMHGTNFVVPPTSRAAAVVTIHDLTYELHPDTVTRDVLQYSTLVRRALQRGAFALVPASATGDAVAAHYGLSRDRVLVTPLGVDDSWATAPAPGPGWLDDRGLPHEYLLFVGSLDPRKNLHRLVDAHQQLRAADRSTPPLVLAGPAGRTSVSRDGLHTTGWLADEDLRTLVRGARALVLPSLDEGFGLPVLEALAAGRPVVISDLPVLHEISGGLAISADPLDVDALASALAAVLSAPDDAAARSARQAWAGRFTWAATADATVEAYRLANSAAGSDPDRIG